MNHTLNIGLYLLILIVLMFFVNMFSHVAYCQFQGNGKLTVTIPGSSDIVLDLDGNIYHTVTIGSQVWFRENLKVTKFNDGSRIPFIENDSVWGRLHTTGYCYYDNDSLSYKSTYGALYNWFAVNTGKLCPKGWHVPTDKEWTSLDSLLKSEKYTCKGEMHASGGKLKEAGTEHWDSPNTGATNSSCFTALPAGTRGGGNGTFRVLGSYTGWWSSTDLMPMYAWFRTITFASIVLNRDFGYLKSTGFSVRCIKDQ